MSFFWMNSWWWGIIGDNWHFKKIRGLGLNLDVVISIKMLQLLLWSGAPPEIVQTTSDKFRAVIDIWQLKNLAQRSSQQRYISLKNFTHETYCDFLLRLKVWVAIYSPAFKLLHKAANISSNLPLDRFLHAAHFSAFSPLRGFFCFEQK